MFNISYFLLIANITRNSLLSVFMELGNNISWYQMGTSSGEKATVLKNLADFEHYYKFSFKFML